MVIAVFALGGFFESVIPESYHSATRRGRGSRNRRLEPTGLDTLSRAVGYNQQEGFPLTTYDVDMFAAEVEHLAQQADQVQGADRVELLARAASRAISTCAASSCSRCCVDAAAAPPTKPPELPGRVWAGREVPRSPTSRSVRRRACPVMSSTASTHTEPPCPGRPRGAE